MSQNSSGAMTPPVDFRGRPFRILESLGGNDQVVFFYPGMSYTPIAPIFFFLGETLETTGWDVVAVDYRYNENTEFLDGADQDKETWFAEDALSIGRWVRHRASIYRRSAIVAKSLGTQMLLHQVNHNLVSPTVDLVWLTPAGSADAIYDRLETLPNRNLVACGTADRYYRAESATRIRAWSHVTLMEVPGAGHSFEAKGDLRRSLANVADVVEAAVSFLQTPSQSDVDYRVFDELAPDFVRLTEELDRELWARNGDTQKAYHGFNRLEGIHDVVVAYRENQALGCAAFKDRGDGVAEVKRVFVQPQARGQGLSKGLMRTLEALASRRGYHELVLETSRSFAEANGLYRALGYRVVPNFPPYEGMEASICYQKELSP